MAMLNKDISYKLLKSVVSRANSIAPSRCRQAQRAMFNAGTTTNFPPVANKNNVTNATENGGDKIFDFDDTKALFASVSTPKLLHSATILNFSAVESMVDLSIWLMNSKLMDYALFRKAVLGGVKYTAYDHFVAGGDTVETGKTVLKLWNSGLRGMLDYGLEHANDNESCDKATKQLMKTIDSTQSLPPTSVSFVAVKVTAICPVYLLRRVSDHLRWEYKNSSCKLPWKQQTLPIFSETSPFYHTLQQPAPLTADEEKDLELSHQRLMTLCDRSFENNVPIVIDAEDTSIQPAIDYLNYWASVKYNESSRPMVYGTIQAYLKDSGDRMALTKKAADKMGLPLGFKLVRGAYMSSERKLAHSLGVESPIHETLLDSHNCYNRCASFMLDEVSDRPGGLILATHNLDSGSLAAQKARQHGITKESQKLEFASLYGMAEAMTFGLRNAGFGVSKYLPFGPVDEIMPYLLRRAEENKGLLSSSNLDRELMVKELKRRVKTCFG
uniref:proline dehydrogenase 2, mitochondrial-like n=1 Tax=Erigeron canadensis TaxID=72917 RepID=UPI001CB8B0F8|nr:proline dehydrogenase 2, mitochondrial-like [Erigeron canadensis]